MTKLLTNVLTKSGRHDSGLLAGLPLRLNWGISPENACHCNLLSFPGCQRQVARPCHSSAILVMVRDMNLGCQPRMSRKEATTLELYSPTWQSHPPLVPKRSLSTSFPQHLIRYPIRHPTFRHLFFAVSQSYIFFSPLLSASTYALDS
jgi:hypothetical protein